MNKISFSRAFLNQTKVGFDSLLLRSSVHPQAKPDANVKEWAFRQTTVTDKFCQLLERRFPNGTTVIVDAASLPEIMTLRACQIYPKMLTPAKRLPFRLPMNGMQNEAAAISALAEKYPLIANNTKVDWMYASIPVEKADKAAMEIGGFSNFAKMHFIMESVHPTGARFYAVSNTFRKSFGTNLHERNVLDFWQNQPAFQQPVAVVTQNWWDLISAEKRERLVKLMQDKLPSKSIVRIGVNELVEKVDQLLLNHGFKPATETAWSQPDYSSAKLKMKEVQQRSMGAKEPKFLNLLEHDLCCYAKEPHSSLPRNPLFIFEKI